MDTRLTFTLTLPLPRRGGGDAIGTDGKIRAEQYWGKIRVGVK